MPDAVMLDHISNLREIASDPQIHIDAREKINSAILWIVDHQFDENQSL